MPTPSSVDQNAPSPCSYFPASSLTPQVMLSAAAVAAQPSGHAGRECRKNLFTLPFLRDPPQSRRTGRCRPPASSSAEAPPLDQRFEGREPAAPNRTGSSAGSPVSASASSIARRAASSSSSRVFSATASTGAGRGSRLIRSCSATSSESGGIGIALVAVDDRLARPCGRGRRRAARCRGSGRA